MPSRNRAREAAKAAAAESSSDRKEAGKKSKGRKSRARKSDTRAGRRPSSASNGPASHATTGSSKSPRTGPLLDPSAAENAETRFVQPYEATKTYICPGCNREIPPGVGHLVAVPPDEPDLRRHWHRGCWHNRHTRF